MNEPASRRLTLRQRWYRLRTSPRFPYLLFFGLLVAGGLSQVYCYWWSVRIERMVARNRGSIDRIHAYPYWVVKAVGHQYVTHLEPIQKIWVRRDEPEKIDARSGDFWLLRGLPFLIEVGMPGKLTAEDAKHLRHLTGLLSAYFGPANDLNIVLDGVQRLPRLETLRLIVDTTTSPSVYRRIALMSQLKRLSVDFSTRIGGKQSQRNQQLGLQELRTSTVYRLETALTGPGQLHAMTRPLSDGSSPFPNLRELCLSTSNGIQINDLKGIENLPFLIHLDLSHCRVNDAHLKCLTTLPYLRTVYLEGNSGITDAGAEILASMPNLQSINVKQTNVTNAGLHQIAALPRLRCLRAYPIGGLEARSELKKQLPIGCKLDTN